jgi:hypothetical protein
MYVYTVLPEKIRREEEKIDRIVCVCESKATFTKPDV